MGKSRRSRAKGGQRADPIAKPVKPPSDPELAALREKSILPVLKDLQSADPKSRTTAAGAIANIVQDTKCRKLLLREQIVHILLTETLTDASLESRAAGWEILRVLTAEEEADFCVHLYRIDVLTAIRYATTKITEAVKSPNAGFKKRPKAEQNFFWSIAEALAEIISALAAAQDEALDAASQSQEILRFLFVLIELGLAPASVLKSALSCMITLSEDNRQFAEAILSDKAYEHLINYTLGDGFSSVYACGVLHNVLSVMEWGDHNLGRDALCDAKLIPTLNQALRNTRLDGHNTNGESSENPIDILQMALEILASIGTALKNSLGRVKRAKKGVRKEVDGEDDDAMDADDDDDKAEDEEDEMDEDEMEADMEMVTRADDDADTSSGIDDLPTLRVLLTIIPQVVTLFNATQGPDEISTMIRSHALTALSNIAWTVSCIDFSENANAAIGRAWTPVAKFLWANAVAPVLASNTSDVGLATMVTSLAWALARALRSQSYPDNFKEVNDLPNRKASFFVGDEHKKFISLYHASRSLEGNTEEDPFQSLGIKCIGVLGQLALDSASTDLNRDIGFFLITVVDGLPDTPAAEAVEALNQLFDIYGDEKSENDKPVFWIGNFLQHLDAAVPKVKAMVKTIDKRKSTELRVRAEEASLNLTRFIQYKQKHRP
ncbi:hypothetical protein F5Y08DRAFT_24672 [Xylaria arbuscula]|nr:hypothetical protein F5Y08DRAFT_24672 [Xylaria arbuscula]